MYMISRRTATVARMPPKARPAAPPATRGAPATVGWVEGAGLKPG